MVSCIMANGSVYVSPYKKRELSPVLSQLDCLDQKRVWNKDPGYDIRKKLRGVVVGCRGVFVLWIGLKIIDDGSVGGWYVLRISGVLSLCFRWRSVKII